MNESAPVQLPVRGRFSVIVPSFQQAAFLERTSPPPALPRAERGNPPLCALCGGVFIQTLDPLGRQHDRIAPVDLPLHDKWSPGEFTWSPAFFWINDGATTAQSRPGYTSRR